MYLLRAYTSWPFCHNVQLCPEFTIRTWKGHEDFLKNIKFEYHFLLLQLALPQLVAGAQFPFNFATGAAAPHMAGFYYPQPMAAAQAAMAQTNYLQGLQGYTFNNFGASVPQGYIRYVRILQTSFFFISLLLSRDCQTTFEDPSSCL